jgi:DNA sulfur modification protein DndE
MSLKEKSVPPTTKIPTDSQVEMSWKTFGGEYADVYDALFKWRCLKDGIPLDDARLVGEHFRTHLHRGLSYLMAEKATANIFSMVKSALSE